ncbi:MAG: hypothetical protein ACFE98_15050 [Candidatus Hermodarchaeota archaeon]
MKKNLILTAIIVSMVVLSINISVYHDSIAIKASIVSRMVSQGYTLKNYIPDPYFEEDSAWDFSSVSLLLLDTVVPDDTKGTWEYDYTTFTEGERSVKLTISENGSTPLNLRHKTSVRATTSFTFPESKPPAWVTISFQMKYFFEGTLDLNHTFPYVRLHNPPESPFPDYLSRVDADGRSEKWTTYSQNIPLLGYHYAFQEPQVTVEFGLEWGNPAASQYPYSPVPSPSETGTAIAWFDNIQVLIPQETEDVEVSPKMEWNQTYNGTEAYGLLQTADGGFALVGGTQAYGAGGMDMWLVKTNSKGVVQWNQTYGGTDYELAYSLIQTTDGGYALGGFKRSFGEEYDTEMWLVKTDSKGNEEWTQTYGGTEGHRDSDQAHALIQTSDGGFALAGISTSFDYVHAVDIWNMTLVKTDKNGKLEWRKSYDQPGAYSLLQTADGGFALAGSSDLVKTDADGVTQWNHTYEGSIYSLLQTTDGEFILAGTYTQDFGTRGMDMWLAKTDTNGDVQWNQTYGGIGDDRANAVVQTADGGFALAGYTHLMGAPLSDLWLVKTDANGIEQWNETYGGLYEIDQANALVQTADGGFALAGGDYRMPKDSMYLMKTESISEPNGDLTPGFTLLSVIFFLTLLIVPKKVRFLKKS